QSGPGARRRVLDVFLALCDAVQHAHQRGVLHRDLKPSNVLVDATGRPRVLDFGLAKFANDAGTRELSRSSEWLGTPASASPEQLTLPSSQLDSRSDVYSLGVILFELVTARKLVEGSGFEAFARALAPHDPPKPSSLDRSVPADLDAIVIHALEP